MDYYVGRRRYDPADISDGSVDGDGDGDGGADIFNDVEANFPRTADKEKRIR